MGYAECNSIMESRTGSVSSGLGCSPGMRGQTVKSSSFCPPSTSKLTQSIIKDHMLSHYKKVYSAKAAIDTSVPRSLIHSVKYNDQIKQDRLRRGDRPQSAHSLSKMNTRTSCSSAQSRLSMQYEDSPYLFSRASVVSSPRFSTSFHAKDIVYSSRKVNSQNHYHHTRPASEIKYGNPEAALHRKQSVYSLAASGDQSCYKAFQDPVQKTYSGDLLQKHSQHFTQNKPFTPKTLKSDTSSYLSKYRYYRAPQRKPTQGSTKSRLMQQETYHGSTTKNKCTQEFDVSTQGIYTEHEYSENEFDGTYVSASRQQSHTNKSRDHYFYDSSSRSSSEVGKSPVMMSVSAEEEELMYLEFISAVTEDILSRGHISDRLLDRVINRHIDMNRDQLDEVKMRHLLDVLRKDFEEPVNTSTSSTELEKKENDLLDTLLLHLESGGKQVETKEDDDPLPYASLIKYCDTPDYTDSLSVFTTLCSPERTTPVSKTNEKDDEGDMREKLSEHVTGNTEICEESSHQGKAGTTATDKQVNEHYECITVINEEGSREDEAEVTYDGQSKELENLGRRLSESLHVSNNPDLNTVNTGNEQPTNTAAPLSLSDDEF